MKVLFSQKYGKVNDSNHNVECFSTKYRYKNHVKLVVFTVRVDLILK